MIDERGVKEYQYDTHYRKQKMAMLKVRHYFRRLKFTSLIETMLTSL